MLHRSPNDGRRRSVACSPPLSPSRVSDFDSGPHGPVDLHPAMQKCRAAPALERLDGSPCRRRNHRYATTAKNAWMGLGPFAARPGIG